MTLREWPSSVCSKAFQLLSTCGNLRHAVIELLPYYILIVGENISALQYIWSGACLIDNYWPVIQDESLYVLNIFRQSGTFMHLSRELEKYYCHAECKLIAVIEFSEAMA
jgi:hypothetical protein